MQRYKAVVFDLDGTLLDTSEGLLASVKYTIDWFGFKALSEDQLRNFIGPPIQNSFARAYNLQGDILQDIATVFRDRYKEVDLLKAKPYKGIYEVFDALIKNNMKPAIATYKRQDYATKILTYFGFDKYTNIMYGADHENKLKKSDIIRLAIQDSISGDYSRAVMVGDSDNDAIGANRIGVDFVGVTYGFGFRCSDDVNKFANVGIASDTGELRDILVGGRT